MYRSMRPTTSVRFIDPFPRRNNILMIILDMHWDEEKHLEKTAVQYMWVSLPLTPFLAPLYVSHAPRLCRIVNGVSKMDTIVSPL